MIRLIMMVAVIIPISIQVVAQTNSSPQEDPNIKIFMGYLQNNWEDIHDVIKRFHHEDPELKGITFIHMDWLNGKLYSATIDSNNTGNEAYGTALIEAMKKWDISGLTESWTITLPIRTEIVGSNHPEFRKRGILTGDVSDINGNPISGARLVLTSNDPLQTETEAVYSNREGIFILTLIPPGDWTLVCTKNDALIDTLETLSFKKGEHIKISVILKE